MFQILKVENTIDFMRWSKVASFFSILIIFVCTFIISTRWLNLGLDFTGGVLIEIEFENRVNLEKIRASLDKSGFVDAVVQNFGSSRNIVVRLRSQDGIVDQALGRQILDIIKDGVDKNAKAHRIEFIGPSVGAELSEAGGFAILASLVCILIYVSIRFEWRLAVGAVVALLHDLIVTLGVFSIMQIEVDLTIVAALLTVVGYSLNDTVVVFDRIRENYRRMNTSKSVDIINDSITRTLSRTLITSTTTLFVVIALFVQGGAILHGFATALFLGIIIGTYSSVYVASTLALRLGIQREHLVST
ncbi:protein translocase subunit SecF [Candidatus Photodesmus blepharus]|uniref:Protein-export membrane protein SecF n=1 Tax=Candidatus Photodesmus blepharonis TaxID=1179155 RepID=A0A084CPD2_9GAMM|nr:protein translocase subunit SecF [Candidatus Photodesmus blepharus]KEY91661.1 protein translocase subunit SecF [Candidatus Photodesmus blepharus]